MDKRTLTSDDIARLRSLAITDHDFLLFVRSADHLGYGRMLQIIEHEWYRAAAERGDPTSGVLVVDTCLGLMSQRKQQDWIAGYNGDPLFERITKP
jgi:hypothetical protein